MASRLLLGAHINARWGGWFCWYHSSVSVFTALVVLRFFSFSYLLLPATCPLPSSGT